ncbi:MAG: NAD(P)/FAD-dependent oxidoreductase [Chitinispirillia bacterium]|jgi:phytoene dehydrogenase-like protein
MKKSKFDAIVIGSGIGGLTTAALLSRFNRKRVLILEQCFNPGGQTQSFQRKGGFVWDTGLQYVGEMADGQLGRVVSDYITDRSLQWKKITPPLERFYFPDFSFDVPDKPQEYFNALVKLFPQEKKAIFQYFHHMKSIRNWTLRFLLNGSFPYPLVILNKIWNFLPYKFAAMTTSHYMNTFFLDNRLKAILTAQWGTYGLPPQKSLFAIHAFITYHFLHGAWYPVGGSSSLFESIIPVIKNTGGRILLNTGVKNIIINNHNRAIGVEALQFTGGSYKEISARAPIIVSGIGINETINNLLDKSNNRISLKKKEEADHGISCVMVFAGLSGNPREAGFCESNYWIFKDQNFNTLFKEKGALISGKPNHCWLSFPSVKDPQAKAHTATLVYFIDEKHFSSWKDKPWKNRGEDYLQLKEKIGQSLILFVNERFPGFKKIIISHEVSTPLTINHFLKKNRGAMYGIPPGLNRFSPGRYGPKSNIKSLFFTGSDAFCSGIVGAMWGGLSSAAAINGQFGMLKLLLAMKFNMFELIRDIYSNNREIKQ